MSQSPVVFEAGYYWARHSNGTTFVVYLEAGFWFTVAVGHPIAFDPDQIIGRVPPALLN